MNIQSIKEPIKIHSHKGGKTEEGYGVCSICGKAENTESYSNGCLEEGYYLFSNPSLGIEESSRVFIDIEKSGQIWVDWCEPSIAPTKIQELLPGVVFRKIQ